jgi:allophanate hydrolase
LSASTSCALQQFRDSAAWTTVGSLLAQIPAPPGLGQVRLADGRDVNRFLVEAAGTEGGTDITAPRGWRAYLDSLN